MAADGLRCPIGREKIDEHSARINGAVVVIILLAALFTPHRWVLGCLVADFSIKVFAGFAYSPSCLVARVAADAMGLPRRMMDSAPKRFAATIGMILAGLGVAVAYLLPASPAVFYGVTATFLVFACLETFAGFCMGCFLFGLLPGSVSAAFVRSARQEV